MAVNQPISAPARSATTTTAPRTAAKGRTGRSLHKTINDAPTALMLTVGFTLEQAARVIKVRRVLPLEEDRKAPCVDGRKLWEKIGKPYKRFDKWAEQYIKPLLLRQNLNAEIWAFEDCNQPGKPSKDYRLSRDIAAQLCMQANTPEGEQVRAYFLDMEDLASRLSLHLAVRVVTLVATDNKVAHMFTLKAGNDAKAGHITKGAVRVVALEKERLLKSTVCEVLTGHDAGHWRATFGRGVREVLDTPDVQVYAQCYETAQAVIAGGITQRDALIKMLTASYGGRVCLAKYLPVGDGGRTA